MGYVIRDWQAPIPVAYVVVTVVVLATSLLLYEFGIRRVNVLRLAFGMRPTTPRTGSEAHR